MAFELPKFTQCCFCFPMRNGLMAWAAFLMVTQFIMLVLIAILVSAYGKNAMFTSWLILIILDFLCGSILYIGALKSHVGLLKLCYFYGLLSIVAHIVIMVVYMFLLITVAPASTYIGMPKSEHWLGIINFGGRAVLEILLLTYIVLLVKSSIDADGGKRRQNQQGNRISIVT